jgi:hypothetical protein
VRRLLQILLATFVVAIPLVLDLVVNPMVLSLVLSFTIAVIATVLLGRKKNIGYPQPAVPIQVIALSVLAAALLGYVYWNYANIRMIPASVAGTLALTPFAGICFAGLGTIVSAAFLLGRVESNTGRTLFLVGLLVPSSIFLLIFVRYALAPPVEWVDEVVLVGYVLFTVLVISAITFVLLDKRVKRHHV